VVDTRARSERPLIVTTHLSMKDLQNPPSLAYKRIYDRVLEMCPIRLKLVGESRRVTNANERKEKARPGFLGL
jgi:DNA replication protein DnaC